MIDCLAWFFDATERSALQEKSVERRRAAAYVGASTGKVPPMRRLHYLIATALGSGYVPKAPGTAGAFLAVLIAFFFWRDAPMALIAATVLVSLIGTWSADVVERDLGREDPGLVVIDEVAGTWLALWFAPPVWWAYLLGFALFRLFDIWKPWPIRSIQHLPGGIGIMVDDLLAGVYALVVLQAVVLFV